MAMPIRCQIGGILMPSLVPDQRRAHISPDVLRDDRSEENPLCALHHVTLYGTLSTCIFLRLLVISRTQGG